jgi:hypothetical protein
MSFNIYRASEEDMKRKRTKGSPSKWPMSSMKLGDAVTITQGQYGKARVSLYPHVFGAQTGTKFAVNKISPDTYRVIRIE